MAEETIERAPTRRESRRLAGQKKENTQPGNKTNVSTKERMGSGFILKLKLRENEPTLAVRGSSSWTSPITTIPKSEDNSLPSSRSNDFQDSRTKLVNNFQKSAATAISSAGRKVRVSLASYYKQAPITHNRVYSPSTPWVLTKTELDLIQLWRCLHSPLALPTKGRSL